MNSNKRLTWDMISNSRALLMGLAMISIIIFHYTDDCRLMNYNYHGIVEWFCQYVSSSGVDVFLFLSGFGLYYSFKRKPDTKQFYAKRFLKILIPYVLVALPAFVWRDLFFEKLGVRNLIKDLSFISFFEEGKVWYWYIFMICVCYLLFPWIFIVFETAPDSVTEKLRLMQIFTFVTVIAILLSLSYEQFFGYINIALLRFPCFFAGTAFGKMAYVKFPTKREKTLKYAL